MERLATILVANGFDYERNSVSRNVPNRDLRLPSYPWQRKTYRYEPTSAAVDVAASRPRHPLLGAKLADGVPEWRCVIDSERLPFLSHHVVGGEVVVPATALAEIALAAAREISSDDAVAIRDFDIVQPLAVADGTQRELSVRHSAITGAIEIYHRPRFNPDEWLLCARGQIVPAPKIDQPPAFEHSNTVASVSSVYQTALETGLDYGKSFRLLERLWGSDDDVMMEVALAPPVDLGPLSLPDRFVLHPASLDCAMHGLLDRLTLSESGHTVWVPIRFERLSVWRPGSIVRGATLKMLRNTPTVKTFDIWLTDADGEVVARLDRALLRPVRLQQAGRGSVYHHLVEVASAPIDDLSLRDSIVDRAELPDQSEARLLLRAHMWASLRKALANYSDDAGFICPTSLNALQVDRQRAEWLQIMLAELKSAGCLVEESEGLRILPNPDLDDPDSILLGFAQDFPEAVSDLILSARASASIEKTLAGEAVASPRAAVVERHRELGLLIAPVRAAIEGLWRELVDAVLPRPLHVAVCAGYGEMLLPLLLEAAQIGTVRLTIVVNGTAEDQGVRRRLPELKGIRCVDLTGEELPTDVDLLIALKEEDMEPINVASASRLLGPSGILAIGEVLRDALALFQTETEAAKASVGNAQISAMRSALESSGLRERKLLRTSTGECALLIAVRDGIEREHVGLRATVKPLVGGEEIGQALSVIGAADQENAIDGDQKGSDEIITIGGMTDRADDIGDVILALQKLLLEGRSNNDRRRLWVICGGASDELRDAIGSFSKVAANEFPERELRWIACDRSLSAASAAEAVAAQIVRPGDERFIAIGPDGVTLTRVHAGLPRPLAGKSRDRSLELEFPRPGILEHFNWRDSVREPLAPQEVEIEVLGSALNFRDMMMAMGLLNDDVVEEGMTGPVMGFECVGKVSAIGAEVQRRKVGDLVVGFGRKSFSTHARAHESFFFPLPNGIGPEASAAIPVAFFTAWYSLVECARMRPGEIVLIHGGAGGVGLAAIQIAKAAGCKVIVTVSSDDKSAVARLFGADHVLNSRTLDFADEIQARFGGVDIVLNSLFGEAMRASLRCLRPRGRFIELGKRDYVANSYIGVRPFRRNLAYFGVDVDQVLAEDPAIAAQGMGEILAGFEDGRYLPIPCDVFDATKVSQAFRTMQAASHVGKIVVRPPSLKRPVEAMPDEFTPGDKVQLIVGGTRGFGLATALWLADRGATKIVVVSRQGVIDESASHRIDELRARGSTFEAEAFDVTELADVNQLVRRVVAEHGPIGGVYHAAAVLEDGLIEHLDPGTLARVLAPKVEGARNLDLATRDQPLDHFVLFSSVSALFGNPGQAAYCAANGYLEGLARKRRSQGLPALAVQWGAIADVGMLADRQDTMRNIERVSGVAAMPSSVALSRLGRLLAVADALPDPVITCAEFMADSAASTLPVLMSPSFVGMLTNGSGGGGDMPQDLAEMIADKTDVEAQRIIAEILAGEVAQILRLPVAEIDLDGSIDALGMDSLMALELRMSIESRYGIELPVMAITSGTNIRALAHRILRTMRDKPGLADEDASLSDAEAGLLAMHAGAALESPRSMSDARTR